MNRSPLKNTPLLMCVVAALAIFTFPADAAPVFQDRHAQINSPIDVQVPVPGCSVNQIVRLQGTIRSRFVFFFFGKPVVSDVVAEVHVMPGGYLVASGTPSFVAHGVTNERISARFLNGQGTATFPGSFKFEERGVRFKIQYTAHVTFTLPANVSVNYDNFTAVCD
jgi:hypothetical protein